MKTPLFSYNPSPEKGPETSSAKSATNVVTTTSAASSNSDDIETYTGTGLGLKIVKDIISSYNGNIYLKPESNIGYTTTFRIEIPKQQSQL